MATNNSNLTISNLDFDAIKSNLKSYLSGQTAFADYNFEGSGMNILLDVLAYNTHYEAFYNNMIANEMFLDSAVDRDNVVSIAKHLGYTPTSKKAATATVDITLGAGQTAANETTFPVGSVFGANMDGKSFQFVNTSVGTIDPFSSGAHIKGLEIKQGKLESFTYVNNISY